MGESVEKRRPIVAGKEGIVLVGFENGCFILDLSNERYSGCTLTSSKFSFIFIFTVYEARNGGEQNTFGRGGAILFNFDIGYREFPPRVSQVNSFQSKQRIEP